MAMKWAAGTRGRHAEAHAKCGLAGYHHCHLEIALTLSTHRGPICTRWIGPHFERVSIAATNDFEVSRRSVRSLVVAAPPLIAAAPAAAAITMTDSEHYRFLPLHSAHYFRHRDGVSYVFHVFFFNSQTDIHFVSTAEKHIASLSCLNQSTSIILSATLIA